MNTIPNPIHEKRKRILLTILLMMAVLLSGYLLDCIPTEYFWGIALSSTANGLQLVSSSRTFPSETPRFITTILDKKGNWQTPQRLYGSFSCFAPLGDSVAVFHDNSMSTYRNGQRLLHRSPSWKWQVQAALPLPETRSLVLFGVDDEARLCAGTFDEAGFREFETRYSHEGGVTSIQAAYLPRRPDGGQFAVFFKSLSAPESLFLTVFDTPSGWRDARKLPLDGVDDYCIYGTSERLIVFFEKSYAMRDVEAYLFWSAFENGLWTPPNAFLTDEGNPHTKIVSGLSVSEYKGKYYLALGRLASIKVCAFDSMPPQKQNRHTVFYLVGYDSLRRIQGYVWAGLVVLMCSGLVAQGIGLYHTKTRPFASLRTEAPVLLSSLFRRGMAFLIDFTLTGAVALAVVSAFDFQSSGLALEFDRSPLIFALLFYSWLITYFTICEALVGQTFGKRLLGIRVSTILGGRPSFVQILIRNLLRAVEGVSILCFAGSFLVIVTKRAQRLGDLAAGTVVVVETT